MGKKILSEIGSGYTLPVTRAPFLQRHNVWYFALYLCDGTTRIRNAFRFETVPLLPEDGQRNTHLQVNI